MATETIHVASGSDLAAVLEKAADKPVILESNGRRYRLIPIRAEGEPEDAGRSFDQILTEVAGSISPEEGERMKDYIYRGREEGTRPFPRP